MMGLPEVRTVSETSFRELDDVFLQTQTRIWLGEVLHVRLDEEVGVADLLADGELLFQVSKEVWKMLLNNNDELKHSKLHMYERTSSSKSERRYMPYPRVDSFLKICQILGLTGVDLFSPSDAVDKRDIRRVCMCIRALSKKARAKKLEVPDFDMVTYNIAMPTDLVGSIRRNLELSQCSSSCSNASSPLNDSREVFGSRIPVGEHYRLSYSGSDETESLVDLEFGSSLSSTSYDTTDVTDTVGESSPVLSSVNDEVVHETSFTNTIQDRNHYENVDENQDEIFDESSSGFCYLSTREAHTIPSSSFTECDCALLSRADDPYYPRRKSRSRSIVPLILPSFTESEFECSSPFSMCSTCTEENNEDEEICASKSNFKIELTEAAINSSSKLNNVTIASSKIRENLVAEVVGNMPNESCSLSLSVNRAVSSHDRQRDDYGKDLDVGRVVESTEILSCSTSTEMVPHDLREGREGTSDESFSMENEVVSYIQEAFVEPCVSSQPTLDSTVCLKETIIADEPGETQEEEARTVEKSGNHVLKSVVSIMTIIGALSLFLLVRKKKDEEKTDGIVMPLQVQKQNQEIFNTKTKTGKSYSLYPGENFKF